MKLYEQKASGRTEEVGEGFNVFAFLFGPLWYLFKGMIGRAILVFFGVLLLTIVLNWFGAVIGWIIMGATANRTYENYLISKGYTIVKKGVKEEKKEEKKEAKKEPEPEYYCEYCDKKFKSEEALNKHYEHCEAKKERAEKDKKIAIWVVGIIIFLGFGVYFLINNKINLIPLVLIAFIITPFFDKTFRWYKKKNKQLKHFEFNWWKKGIAIGTIIILFVLVNLIIPQCPRTCDDNNPCTNDFCGAETGYKCMNTIKLNCDGNGICEAGEYGKSADCPNCDDGNKCTADSYDTASKQCVHVEMKGCIQ